MTTVKRRSHGMPVTYWLAAAALLMAAGVFAWYRWGAHTAAPVPMVLEQVIIAANTEYVGVCPLIVAQHNNYFQQEGLAVVIQRHSTGKAALDAVLDGQANLATTADIPVMFAAMNNIPIAIIATIFKTEMDHGIVARTDRGIGAASSLKGKRIGVTLSTSGHFVLNALLNRQHLASSDVTLLNLSPAEFAGALARDEIDAAATWEPFLGDLQAQLGGKGKVFYGEDVYEIPYNIVGTRAYVKRQTGSMTKLLRGLIKGASLCRTAPAEALAIMATVLKTDTAKWKTHWPTYRFGVALDQGLILALEDESRWAISNQLTKTRATPNFLEYIHIEPLNAIAPSAVTIIR